MPDPRPLNQRTPARLEIDAAVPVPETPFTATMLRRTYAHGRSPEGRRMLVSSATIRLDAPGDTSETIQGPFYQTYDALGSRFYLDGSRSETLLYALDT